MKYHLIKKYKKNKNKVFHYLLSRFYLYEMLLTYICSMQDFFLLSKHWRVLLNMISPANTLMNIPSKLERQTFQQSQSLVFQLDPNHPESANCREHQSMYERIPTVNPQATICVSAMRVSERCVSQRGSLLATLSHLYWDVQRQLCHTLVSWRPWLHFSISVSFQ